MAYTIESSTVCSVKAVTENGDSLVMSGVTTERKGYYKVHEMNGRHNTMELFNALSQIAKSGNDNKIIGCLVNLANGTNEIHIHNMTKFAEEQEINKESLKKLFTRAVDNLLLYKISTGHYMLNPYIIMSKALTAAGMETQELAQIKWREVTGLLTQQQIDKIVNLSSHLELPTILRATEFNLSVAEYYHSKGVITEKQKQAILKSSN